MASEKPKRDLSFLLPQERWVVYCIILDIGRDEFFIKVGVSKDARQRVAMLDGGLPVDPMMLISPETSKSVAYWVERNSHEALDEFKSRAGREWFRVSLDKKSKFFQTIDAVWAIKMQSELKWRMIDKTLCRASKLLQSKNKRKYHAGLKSATQTIEP